MFPSHLFNPQQVLCYSIAGHGSPIVLTPELANPRSAMNQRQSVSSSNSLRFRPAHRRAGSSDLVQSFPIHIRTNSFQTAGVDISTFKFVSARVYVFEDNVELKALVADPSLEYCRESFRFAFLESWPNRTADEAVIVRESFWKRILLTRGEQGLNRN